MLFHPLLAILGLVVFLLYPYALTAWKITRRVYQCLTFEDEDAAAAISPEIAEVFRVYERDLAACGLQLVKHSLLHNGSVDDRPLRGRLFQDPTASCYAGVAIIQPFQPTQPIVVGITTFWADGTILRTTSNKSYGAFKSVPGEISQILLNAPIAELWQAHQSKLTELSELTAPLVLSADEFLEKLTEQSIQSTDLAVRQGEASWVEVGKTFRWGWKPAVKLTAKIGRELLFKQNSPANPHVSPESAIELEAQAFLQELAPKPPMSKQKRGWIALGSLALFVAVYATKFDRNVLWAFLGTLILHEGGHLAAMLWFGYRAPAVLFIPYLGALATARKAHASLTEKVWIALAGPIPGLVLGIGIVIAQTWGQSFESLDGWFAGSNFWHTASSILIALNLFNLLPIYPLDGGQIAELLVFSRNPYLGLIYKCGGVFLLLLIGLLSPLLFVFAIVIALTIPTSFRTARWFAKLRRELRDIPWQDDEAAARLIFRQLQAAPKLSSWQKNSIAFGIFDARRENAAPWSSRLGLSVIYLISLLAGMAGGLYAIVPDLKVAIQITQDISSSITYMIQGPEGMMRDRLKQADREIQANPRDLKAYLKRSAAKSFLKDTEGALADVNYVLQQDPQSQQAYSTRSMIYRRLGDAVKADADQKQADKLVWTPRFAKAHAAIKQNPQDATAYYDRGIAKYNLGDFKGAFQDYDRALALKPNDTQFLLSRSWLYQFRKNYPAALNDVNRVIQLQPNNPIAYESRAEIYRHMNQPEKAIVDEQKAQELYGPDDGEDPI
jgi:tetratricopeptide (TPR) repeat protein